MVQGTYLTQCSLGVGELSSNLRVFRCCQVPLSPSLWWALGSVDPSNSLGLHEGIIGLQALFFPRMPFYLYKGTRGQGERANGMEGRWEPRRRLYRLKSEDQDNIASPPSFLSPTIAITHRLP